MRPIVEDVFPSFTDRFEGTVRTMYADVKNLVTVGRGNLIDPVSAALTLPWVRLSDGSTATDADVRAEWSRVKQGGFAALGWRAAERAAKIALSPQSIDDLTLAKLHANDAILAARFDGWERLPASAQLATHSLAWACGPAFRFPRFEAALRARDWATCADECQMDAAGNPGLVPRNLCNKQLFLACLTASDPDDVAWPPAESP